MSKPWPDYDLLSVRVFNQVVKVLHPDAVPQWANATLLAFNLTALEMMECNREQELYNYVCTYTDPSYS